MEIDIEILERIKETHTGMMERFKDKPSITISASTKFRHPAELDYFMKGYGFVYKNEETEFIRHYEKC